MHVVAFVFLLCRQYKKIQQTALPLCFNSKLCILSHSGKIRNFASQEMASIEPDFGRPTITFSFFFFPSNYFTLNLVFKLFKQFSQEKRLYQSFSCKSHPLHSTGNLTQFYS